MSSSGVSLHAWWRIIVAVEVVFVSLAVRSFGLNTDAVLLLSFKYSILNDPLRVLESWNYKGETPCSWDGVTCTVLETSNGQSRVTGLSLPNSQLLGSIPANLGMIEHLQNLNLSNNSLNGSLPFSLFNATELRSLDLSSNMISGELPETVNQLQNLHLLNLSDNALAGNLPTNLTSLSNLTVVSLKNNYFSGSLPGGFEVVQVLDLSSNLVNGPLPPDFGGNSLSYFNISYNRLSGEIPAEFGEKIPANAKIDLSFNNLTGKIPDSSVFVNQETNSFSGNPDLCGEPSKKPCPIPSSASSDPNVSAPTSPPAIAAIPKTTPGTTPPGSANTSQGQNRLGPRTIVGIVIGDVAGIMILGMVSFYVYQFKKKKNVDSTLKKEANTAKDVWSSSSSSSESRGFTKWSCLRKRGDDGEESETTGSDTEEHNGKKGHENQRPGVHDQDKKGTLVTVDGEKELELETLLKASAYILGATGSSIMYKAVLEDGTTLAVRRIGESSVDRFRDFETHVRVIAKLVHPNLVRIRGFYWGVDEKLVIYDFVPNGSLANARYRKAGSSPCHLPWETRLKIAKGMARGLAFLHEKKHVHANLKPSNILLGSDMEPRIGDFGLERLLTGETSYKAGGSSRIFGSKRSTASRDSFQDAPIGPSPSPSPSPSSLGCVSPYQAPESLRNLKPNPKWDVYSFGVILLELLTGKVIVVDDLGQGNGLTVEDKNRALRMADMAIRADVEGKEDALLACFKLGYSCAKRVMEDDWDLHAVVRGYTTTTTTASSTTTTSYNSTAGATTSTADFHLKSFFSPFGGEQAGYLFSPADPFEATKAFEELHELYKPFFPKSHSVSPQSTPISSLPSLAVSKNQTHHHQQQQHKQCSLTSAASTTISNSTTASSHTPRSKRRKNQLKRVCQVPAEGLASDVWAWRKYGQKPIKGSPYPRGYYRCSSSKGCLARKQVERNRSDPGMFIVTYTAEHNHPAPTHRNSLAGSTRKPFTPQTANAGDSSKPFTKPVATAAPLVAFSSSPTTSVEDELIVPQSTKVESMDDLVVEDDEEEDLLGLSDTVMSDDFFEGLEGLPGTDSGDCFSDLLPTSLGLPWLANNAATAAGGI